MWVIIVLLSVGLFNIFQDPNKVNTNNNNLPFSNFLNEVDAGRVVEVKIQGNNISGVLSDGKNFNTYSENSSVYEEKNDHEIFGKQHCTAVSGMYGMVDHESFGARDDGKESKAYETYCANVSDRAECAGFYSSEWTSRDRIVETSLRQYD